MHLITKITLEIVLKNQGEDRENDSTIIKKGNFRFLGTSSPSSIPPIHPTPPTGGGDVYFQGDHFHSLNSTSREVSFKQIHAWQGSSLVPIFEFRTLYRALFELQRAFSKRVFQKGIKRPCNSIMEIIMPKTLMPLDK